MQNVCNVTHTCTFLKYKTTVYYSLAVVFLCCKWLKETLCTEVMGAAAFGAVDEGTRVEDGDKGDCHFILIVLFLFLKKKKIRQNVKICSFRVTVHRVLGILVFVLFSLFNFSKWKKRLSCSNSIFHHLVVDLFIV